MKKYLFLLACFGFFIGCKKYKIIPDMVKLDKYSKPNKMWVYVDTVEHESCVSRISPPSAQANYHPSYLQLSGSFGSCATDPDITKWFKIYMEVVNVHKVGIYTLGDSLSGFGLYSRYVDNNFTNIVYVTNQNYTGEVKITDFQVNTGKVSGEFFFTAFNKDKKNSIALKGKFNDVTLIKHF
jgi:Family of unknown function (DUF6252)